MGKRKGGKGAVSAGRRQVSAHKTYRSAGWLAAPLFPPPLLTGWKCDALYAASGRRSWWPVPSLTSSPSL